MCWAHPLWIQMWTAVHRGPQALAESAPISTPGGWWLSPESPTYGLACSWCSVTLSWANKSLECNSTAPVFSTDEGTARIQDASPTSCPGWVVQRPPDADIDLPWAPQPPQYSSCLEGDWDDFPSNTKVTPFRVVGWGWRWESIPIWALLASGDLGKHLTGPFH